MAEKKGIKVMANNRKAFHDYFVEDKLEAGIELKGTEVKSVRAGTLNLKDSYVIAKNGEAYVHSMHISPYDKGNIFNHDPDRPKRLLLHKREINKLYALEEKLILLDKADLWADFGHLQESDHLYYMCTKFFSDGEVHKMFNPYDTPYEAFINYMNVLSDFIIRVNDAYASKQ